MLVVFLQYALDWVYLFLIELKPRYDIINRGKIEKYALCNQTLKLIDANLLRVEQFNRPSV